MCKLVVLEQRPENVKHCKVKLESSWTNIRKMISRLKFSGHYMHHQFSIQQHYVLPTQCIYAFCVYLRTNSDYFPIQH
jgi:hypothetical protein